MKSLCKKVVVFLLVAILASSTCFSGVMAEEKTLADQIAALPDYTQFTSVADEGFDKALADAEKLIAELAKLSDDEFDALENASKVFDLYVALNLLNMCDGMPTQVPTKEDVISQLRWVNDATAKEPEILSYLLDFTTVTVTDVDEQYYEPIGNAWYNDASMKMGEVVVRIVATVTTLTEEEQAAIAPQTQSWLLEAFPETFTVENFWDYAVEYYSSLYTLTEDDVVAECADKFNALLSSFESLVADERPTLIEELEKRIAAQCDLEAAENASYLSLLLYHQLPCDELWYNVDLLSLLYEEDASSLLSNYELFDEYYNLVNPEMDFMMYGDLDYDGEVNAKDALVALKITVDKIEATEDDLWVGDVDGDGDVSAKDALEILKYTVGKIEWFPVEDFEVELG